MNRWLPPLVLVGSLSVAGCGDGQELAVPVETMVEFEATWQCDVTRYSFPDSDAIEAKERELRIRFGVGADDQATFVTMLDDDDDLRQSLAETIDARCPAVGTTEDDA